jgi:hypothetical protein
MGHRMVPLSSRCAVLRTAPSKKERFATESCNMKKKRTHFTLQVRWQSYLEEYPLLSSPSQQWKLLAAIAVLIEACWTEANALAYLGTNMRHYSCRTHGTNSSLAWYIRVPGARAYARARHGEECCAHAQLCRTRSHLLMVVSTLNISWTCIVMQGSAVMCLFIANVDLATE